MSDAADKRTRGSQSRDRSSKTVTPRRDFFTSQNTSKRSPVSPTRITRLQEKEEMQSLNDRLIIYMQTVRNLEAENYQLKHEATSVSEVSTRDISEIKVLYERELSDAKKLIDELAREKARLEIEMNKYKADAGEVSQKMKRLENEAKQCAAGQLKSESELVEYKSRCDSMVNELNRKSDELKILKPQCVDLEHHLARLRKQLEEETLARVDLENKNSTLKEDLNFKSQIYEKETDQLRSSKRNEIEQVDCRLRDEYDSKLMNELNKIRTEAENKIHEMKDEVERRYQNKSMDAESNVKRSQQQANALREELANYRLKHDDYETDIKNLTVKIATYEQRNRDMEERIKKQAHKFEQAIVDKDADIDKSRTELNALLNDYQELYDIKIALDMEIEAYRKILESGENHLNMSTINNSTKFGSSFTETSPKGKVNNKKRKLEDDDFVFIYNQSASSAIGLQICEFTGDTKAVTLCNKSDKDVACGGWTIKQQADDYNVDYKIPKSRVVKVAETLTIYSNSAADLKKADDLLMAGNKQWLSGNSVIFSIVDKEGNEMSRRECQKDENKMKDSSILSSTKIVKTEIVSEGSTSSLSSFKQLFSWKNK